MRIILAALALILSLAACGGADDNEIRSGGSEGDPASTTATSGPDSRDAAVPAACDLADEADVEAAYGEDVPPGTVGGGGHDEDGLQWQSDNCNFDVEDGLEVTVAVSTGEDFAEGEVLCPELDSFDVAATPMPELTEHASWVNDKIDPNEGTLRICTDTSLIDVDVESPDGSRDPDILRDQTVALAEVVLANLG